MEPEDTTAPTPDRFPARKALWETGEQAHTAAACLGGETENCGIAKGWNTAE